MTLRELDAEFSRSEQRAEELLQRYGTEPLNRRPGPRKWSALECLEHLVLTNRLNAGALARALQGAGAAGGVADDTVKPGWVWRLLLKGVDPRSKLKAFAPGKLRPGRELDAAETMQRFRETHVELRALMEKSRAAGVHRVRFIHPAIYLPITPGTTFCLLALHEARHLGQAERAAAG